MFAKIFFKEWRENILIFSLAIFFMLALVVLSLSNQRELTLNFSGMFLLLFLPFAALLIGSGGFYSEFKDNAWIYLFSRPIRKEIIWIFKYVSLLSILTAIFVIFFLVKQFLPGLDEILQDINFPTEFRSLLSFNLYFVVPLLALTISFSISVLYEKQFIIFFVSILIGTALAFIYGRYILFLGRTYFYYGNLKGFALFIALSFILASILTLVRSDFSQMGKKILTFSKFVLLFLVLSFALGTVWIARGNPFSGKREFSAYFSFKHKGNVYADSRSQGIIRYNSELDKVEKLGGKSRYLWRRFSVGGDKIAFYKYAKSDTKKWLKNLWIMNTDGSKRKVLVETNKPESPFYNLELSSNCLLSRDGSQVAFINYSRNKELKKTEFKVWWMNTDGTGLRSQTLDFPMNYTDFRLFAWPVLTNNLILGLEEKGPTFKRLSYKIVNVNLEEGNYRILVENAKGGAYRSERWISPKHEFLALDTRDSHEGKEILTVLNLKTLEEKKIFKADLLKLWSVKWSQNEDKILFSREKELWVYFLAENRAQKIVKRNYGFEVGFDWLSNGQKLVLIAPINGEYFLKVLGEDFKEEKSIKIPYPIEEPVYIWGLSDKMLVRFRYSPLFRLNLETEEWKKVY